MKNHSEIAEFLWKIADLVKDDYDAKNYEDVILPFTLLRRLDCMLEPKRQAVREAAEKYKAAPEKTRDALLTKAAGQRFYNTSEYSLAELLKRPADLGPNFAAYLGGFSANVKDILYNFSGGEEKGLGPIYETLLRKRLLFKVANEFAQAPLDPETVDNHGMGTIFEYLIRKFKEASNEAAGQFYTPRDIIRLMVKLVFEPDRELPGKQFNYMLSNPPFGKDWKNIREEIEAEHKRGVSGRYSPGLPDVGDGAMLFLLHKLSKMTPHGSKIALIFNGSPLFNGDAGSGPSNIRKHILENDWLDAIVALPNDLFYNTGIATYIWLINNRKPAARRNRVQLINATGPEFYTMLRRNLGKKRVEISEDQSAAVLAIYEAFEETKVSRIFDTEDFGYTKVCVERPLRLRYDLTEEQRDRLRLDKEVLKLKDDRADQLAAALEGLANQAPWRDDSRFFSALTEALPWKPTAGLMKTMRATLGVRDETAEPVCGEDGLPVPDSELRDFENVPLKEDIDEYFRREVLPHVPDAWMDRAKDKVGYEISFTKYFYEYTPLRSTAEIAAELLKLDEETENLLREIAQV